MFGVFYNVKSGIDGYAENVDSFELSREMSRSLGQTNATQGAFIRDMGYDHVQSTDYNGVPMHIRRLLLPRNGHSRSSRTLHIDRHDRVSSPSTSAGSCSRPELYVFQYFGQIA